MSTQMAERKAVSKKDTTDLYLSHFDEIEKQAGREPGAWFLPIRKAAISCFAELGFPTTAHEEWRYTNVAPIAERAFSRAVTDGVELDRAVPAALAFQKGVHTFVFVNGVFRGDLSTPGDLPEGVRVLSLKRAMAGDEPIVRDHLARHARFEEHPFTALNTALLDDGAVVHLGRGAVADRPIHLIHVSTGGEAPFVTHPRTLVVAEENSEARVVETFAGPDGGIYFTNAVCELVIHENATVDHYKITQESPEAFHIGTIQLHQFRSSNGRTFVASFDGALARHDINTLLDGEGCDCGMNGLYLVDGTRHVDNHLVVEHAKPHCDSREFFKGVLDGKGKGVFSGRIIVRQDAQKTDAKQTNMSLLLSRDAQVESKPQLEIFADDVKCTHGATIGQMNDEALFYLRSRGIPHEAARTLMVYAFAAEALERVRIEPLRAALERMVFEKLPHGDLMAPQDME